MVNINKSYLDDNLKSIFISLLTSFILIIVLYFLRLRYVEDFTNNYGFQITFAALTYAIILPAVKQVRSYVNFSNMSGMMIGMTLGMVSGFMPGFIIGTTNGMFYGSVFGMTVGIALGIYNGKTSGVMGVMEGIMAGFMGGLMGAMTAVMMLNDHLKAATIILFLISGLIMTCLLYLMHQEKSHLNKDKETDNLQTIALTFILMAATIWLMVFGPRSFLFQ